MSEPQPRAPLRMASERLLRELILPCDGRVLPFRELSESAQLALLQYMAVDGSAWAELMSGLEECESGGHEAHTRWLKQALPEAITRHGHECFGCVRVPMGRLAACVLDDVRDSGLGFGSWEEYHDWYLGGGDMPSYPDTRWPVILGSLDGEALADGSHRLHDYFRRGDSEVDCLYFPAPSVEKEDV